MVSIWKTFAVWLKLFLLFLSYLQSLIINLCKKNHLDQSRIQMCLDCVWDLKQIQYDLLFIMCHNNPQYVHLLYAFIFPDIDFLTREILQGYHDDYQCILSKLPHDCMYLTEIHNSFVRILNENQVVN